MGGMDGMGFFFSNEQSGFSFPKSIINAKESVSSNG